MLASATLGAAPASQASFQRSAHRHQRSPGRRPAKPYSGRELLARIKAVLRRRGEAEAGESDELVVGRVAMDVERHVVTVGGKGVAMPLKEFELLEMLMRNEGRVLTRMQLIDRVWGSDYVGDTKTLDVHIKRLRAKIEPDPGLPQHILTVRGLGYKLEA